MHTALGCSAFVLVSVERRYVFFFSSRRRHTRLQGDWSSDVCSSDLGKGLAFQEGYNTAWEIMARDYPDAVAGSTNRYANWEVVDPEKWVPGGYVCIRKIGRASCRERV